MRSTTHSEVYIELLWDGLTETNAIFEHDRFVRIDLMRSKHTHN